jgi:aminoglycoside phosphotransferase (APT) family kinase protein
MDDSSDLAPLKPPGSEVDANRWYPTARDEPATAYLAQAFPELSAWQVTRLFGAAYAYRAANGRTLVLKFYSLKSKVFVEHYAARERKAIDRARRVIGDNAVEVLDQIRGVLVMPYVPGLSLQSAIAVRRNHAGGLSAGLIAIARLLAELHAGTVQLEPRPDFTPAAAYGRKVVQNLAEFGVLEGDPLTSRALESLIARWEARSYMHDFAPVFVHGDVTTGNFLFPAEASVVALDWERAQTADPAQDLGRLAAEVTHSIVQHGGSVAEAIALIDDFTAAYVAAIPAAWSSQALVRRAQFYRAISSLRIARNPWSPREQRSALVGQAFALLSAVD